MEYAEETEVRQNGNENMNKVEIRNSEIKCLKKPNAGQVRDMVAQLQSTIDTNRQDSQTANVIAARSHSRLNNNFQHIEATSSNPSPTYSIPHRNTAQAQFGLPERHIPKDAYFHELPHRAAIPQNPQRRVHSAYAPNANFYRNEDPYVERIPLPNAPLRQADYVGAVTYRPIQSPTFQAIVPPHPNPRPRNWPHPNLAPNDIDLDEVSAVGLYNNVSSLV